MIVLTAARSIETHAPLNGTTDLLRLIFHRLISGTKIRSDDRVAAHVFDPGVPKRVQSSSLRHCNHCVVRLQETIFDRSLRYSHQYLEGINALRYCQIYQGMKSLLYRFSLRQLEAEVISDFLEHARVHDLFSCASIQVTLFSFPGLTVD